MVKGHPTGCVLQKVQSFFHMYCTNVRNLSAERGAGDGRSVSGESVKVACANV